MIQAYFSLYSWVSELARNEISEVENLVNTLPSRSFDRIILRNESANLIELILCLHIRKLPE